MRLQRRVRPDRLEALDEIARRHHLDAQLAHGSMVPASTRETYGMALPGEYSIATRRTPVSSVRRPAVELLAPA